MKNNRLFIIGASGHGKVVADIALLNGYTLAEIFATTTAKTIYIAVGTFLVILCTLLIIDWGRK